MSPATLYRYFPSREALLDPIADETLFNRLGNLPYPETPDEITFNCTGSHTSLVEQQTFGSHR